MADPTRGPVPPIVFTGVVDPPPAGAKYALAFTDAAGAKWHALEDHATGIHFYVHVDSGTRIQAASPELSLELRVRELERRVAQLEAGSRG